MDLEQLKIQMQKLQAGEVIEETSEGALFGIEIPQELAQLCVIGVPWDRTSSYHRGSAAAPRAVCEASHFMDHFDYDFGFILDRGIAFERLENIDNDLEMRMSCERVNETSQKINKALYEKSFGYLKAGKKVAVLGGDHSTPYGLLQACGEVYDQFGILHIDAHHDLRVAYEGYQHSHASIMYNAMENISSISKLASIGIRDFSLEEKKYFYELESRGSCLYDREISARKFRGESFSKIISDFIYKLPQNIYISFDIDGLSPELCSGTGTPVPGGLSYAEMEELIYILLKSDKNIIGFDLCEVSPQSGDGDWNANVGARVLHKLCGLALKDSKSVI